VLRLGGTELPERLRGHDLTPVLAESATPGRDSLARSVVDLSPVIDHPNPAHSVRDSVHFTYDDHQAATALTEAPGQPNRIRAIRTPTAKYAFYFDPEGRRRTEYELYDLERDPLEVDNLLEVRTGVPRDTAAAALHRELAGRLADAMSECGTEISGGQKGRRRITARP
jgi:choline-sulfatase